MFPCSSYLQYSNSTVDSVSRKVTIGIAVYTKYKQSTTKEHTIITIPQ